ncbi:MAG: hypothetical protein ISS15_11940 [Alphaproteobacteria bacterium]|nr:hypothetical protein [Alphaproteobacteria bacterium]MBL6936586.1 hypothetical protein [Alphaproteobacteria bacterium]MBL7098363.1 hypothetical protein [Alphaproteobacteria bacterium]
MIVMMMIVPVAIPIVFVRHVVADGAACDCAEQAVMNKVPGDPADDRALYAAPGFRPGGRPNAERGDHGKSKDELLHGSPLHRVHGT